MDKDNKRHLFENVIAGHTVESNEYCGGQSDYECEVRKGKNECVL